MKKKSKIKIIAEAGVNHNGKMSLAKKLIDAASESGADYIKFQMYNVDELIIKNTSLADYQKKKITKNISQYDMLKKLSLSKKNFHELYKYSKIKKIKFLASPFDLDSCSFLHSLGLNSFKIPSGEINNIPYLELLGKFKKNILSSTGMSNLNEINFALKTLIKAGTKKENITILHCNSEYPTPIQDINMRAMTTIKNKFKIDIGYSDHSDSIEVPIAAVALGAKVIEKHITLNKQMKGPDHLASMNPLQFKKMIQNIRNCEIILGSGIKKLSPSEIKNIKLVRKSIVANIDIQKGDKFSKLNLAIKRPGYGIPATHLKKIIGKKSKKNYIKNDLIKL